MSGAAALIDILEKYTLVRYIYILLELYGTYEGVHGYMMHV